MATIQKGNWGSETRRGDGFGQASFVNFLSLNLLSAVSMVKMASQ
jgi:hypothetical protein